MDISQMTTPKPTRRSPFSFLRSVKSLFLPSRPAESFVPALPHLDRSTPVPFARSLFNRTFRKCPPRPPHPPGSDPRRSFFDDDDDDLVDNVDRRVLSPSRLSVSCRTDSGRIAHSNSRLSSAFAHTSPDLSSISSVVPTSCSIAEQRDTLTSDSRTDLRQSKTSPISRLRTKISLTKLVSPNSQPSSSTNTSQALAPSSFSYHPYSDNGHAHPYAAQLPEDRSFTPEDDPFRKDEVAPTPLAVSRFPDSSPRSTSIHTHGESRKHLTGSRSLPVLPSGQSSGPDSPSTHALTENGGSQSPSGPSQGTFRTPLPTSQRHNISPPSLTFPLPPSPQDSVPFAVPIVQVIPPASSPPPAYPPPLSPPPLEPLPCPPPVSVDKAFSPEPLEGPHKEGSSRRRSERDSSKPVKKSTPVRRLNSHARADRSPSSFSEQYRAASSRAENHDFRWTPEKRIPQRKNRPLTPFPLPLLAGQVKHDPTGRLQALEAAPCLMSSQADLAIDQTADAMTDSEVEPDLDFNSSKARKKISVSSAKSAQSAISSFSIASGSTSTSSTSIATASTAATTVSPSITSVDKTGHGSQVPIADEDGTIVSAEMYSTLSPPDSPSPELFALQSAGIYLKQGGTIMHEPPNDLLLAGGEQVIVGATDWVEFRNFCDARHDTSLRFAGSTRGDGIADILVVEVQHSGKVRGIELLLSPRHPSPCTNADFTRRIPGSYPPSDPPALPRVSPIDVPHCACNEWIRGPLTLEGTPSLRDGPQLSSISVLNEPNRVHEGEMRRTLLALVAILPTTLRDLVIRAGETCLPDGIAGPRDSPCHLKATMVNP
ncbi:hypothetical protein EDB87DRAFT_1613491 [Lactarius vividus]|nr:hypothetical protein EDB87DRAFT_1613491 [Lactarius vividus]